MLKWRIFEWRAIVKGDEGKRRTFGSGPEKVHQWRTWQGEDASNVERVISLHNIKPELILFHDHYDTYTISIDSSRSYPNGHLEQMTARCSLALAKKSPSETKI